MMSVTQSMNCTAYGPLPYTFTYFATDTELNCTDYTLDCSPSPYGPLACAQWPVRPALARLCPWTNSRSPSYKYLLFSLSKGGFFEDKGQWSSKVLAQVRATLKEVSFLKQKEGTLRNQGLVEAKEETFLREDPCEGTFRRKGYRGNWDKKKKAHSS